MSYKKNVGKLYDVTNNSSMFESLPHWITSEDQNEANSTLKNLTQIISGSMIFNQNHKHYGAMFKILVNKIFTYALFTLKVCLLTDSL